MKSSAVKVAISAVEQLALQQAAEWFAVLSDDAPEASERQAWQAWLTAHPAHQRAWAEVEAINAAFSNLNAVASKSASHQALLHSSGRRQALKMLGLAGVTYLGVSLLHRYSPWQDWLTTLTASAITYRTPAGRTHRVLLADQGKLWLNTDTQVRVAYGWMLRRITLEYGEILLQSGHDPQARPLVVDTQHGRLTALGTRFTVCQEATRTLLAVYEGRVAITPSQGTAITLSAGQQAYFDRHGVGAIQAALPAREAWTRGILIADNQSLKDFIAELARYHSTRLSVAPDIAHLRLMGAYPFANVPLVLQEITHSLGIRQHTDAQGNIQLLPAS